MAGTTLQGAAGAAVGAAIPVAHGGLTNVPSESTFLLDKGERVLSPNQNKDFTDFINGEGSAGTVIEIGSINISTSASSFEDIDQEEIIEFVADKIIPALDKLDDSGIRQKAIERSNV